MSRALEHRAHAEAQFQRLLDLMERSRGSGIGNPHSLGTSGTPVQEAWAKVYTAVIQFQDVLAGKETGSHE